MWEEGQELKQELRREMTDVEQLENENEMLKH